MSVALNTYMQNQLAGGDRVCFYYHAADRTRAAHGAYWSVGHFVDGVPKKTDPDGPWYAAGHKTFSVPIAGLRGHTPQRSHKERKLAALDAAVAWAAGRYGRTFDLVRNRMGDYVEREVNEAFPLPVRKRGKS